MKTAFYVAGDVGDWSVFNRLGQPISRSFASFDRAVRWLNSITATHAEHRLCDLCGEGFVTGIADVLCPKCRPKIRSKKS